MIITLEYLESISNTTNSFYCVAKGLKTGIYGSYTQVEEQVSGVANNQHFRAKDAREAVEKLDALLFQRFLDETAPDLNEDEIETMFTCLDARSQMADFPPII